MDKKPMKLVGIVCLAICAVCIFVAVERNIANANNVKAINTIQQSTPFGQMMGGGNLKPAMPTATKYAILFAAISGIGGVILLVKST